MIDKFKNKKITVYLTDYGVETLLNDGEVTVISGGTEVKIGKSLVVMASAPLINRPIKAVNTEHHAVVNKNYFNHLVSDSFNR
ncbi:hypothetical protein [Macrococcoides canis]|uniref:hypothetical protein n=1 Tax=Macrococcoides canis TaxID=1855823 RepID=UPI0020B67F69|nr:hypothetical protein [Macrococcus canis]UTH10799.1 hypothetical protein KFV10_07705 [Macrococcus canis]